MAYSCGGLYYTRYCEDSVHEQKGEKKREKTQYTCMLTHTERENIKVFNIELCPIKFRLKYRREIL